MSETSPATATWSDKDTLVVQAGGISLEYLRGPANQLILNARMNPWESFLGMLEKKTDAATWPHLKSHLSSLDKTSAWKFKESFARLSTNETE